ncbi:Hypothetical protein A7982_09191 [Minicystis rosea]|nr:Hypothetical protein A7982_09191 [Minicystis rosea]
MERGRSPSNQHFQTGLRGAGRRGGRLGGCRFLSGFHEDPSPPFARTRAPSRISRALVGHRHARLLNAKERATAGRPWVEGH